MSYRIFKELLIILLVGCFIGLLMAVVANLFVLGVQSAKVLRESSQLLSVGLPWGRYSLAPIIFLLLAALAVIGLRRLLRLGAWAGPADSIYAAHNVQHRLDIKQGAGSTLAAFISAAGGASVGQYGPVVHFGATVGCALRRVFGNLLSQDIFLGCGVAAAISAGFNAPLAGVVFAHEAVLRHFSPRAIAPIFIAAISASTFDSLFFSSSGTTFQIHQSVPPLVQLAPILLLLGPLAALVAISFMTALRGATALGKHLPLSANTLPVLAALICGSTGVFLPQILGIGIDGINGMIAGDASLNLLLALLVGKLVMTALCIGFGLFGGVFSPALFVGVATGAIVAQLLAGFGITGLDEVISVAAMAAVSAAVIGAPISAVLIVLELTGSYGFAVAAMIAVIISNLLTHRLFGQSYFDRQLLDRGIDLRMGRESLALDKSRVGDYVGARYLSVPDSLTGHELMGRMAEGPFTEAYIVDSEQQLLGKVTVFDSANAGSEPIASCLDRNPLCFNESESLAEVMHKVSRFVGESIPVLAADSRRVLGVVTEGDLFQAVLQVQNSVRQLERS
ncbi:MAG: hypothetical protein PsegKO_25690 [Pseudohongiellaceae bacterium]